MSDDDKFWAAVERLEQDFTADCDVARFRDRMKKLGLDDDVIRERVESIHPRLVGEL